MNEDQVTTLLDRLTQDLEVSHPPVAATADAGRRRLRWRHRAQVGGAAAVVLAIAGGGLAIQQQLTADAQPTNHTSVVGPPENSIVGRWVPVVLAGNPNPREGAAGRSVFVKQGQVPGRLIWTGQDDCNRVRGVARVQADGTYHARMTFNTDRPCLPMLGYSAYSAVDAITEARHVDVKADRLTLAGRSGQTLAAFDRYDPAEQPDRPSLSGHVPTRDELLGTWRPIELAQRNVSAEHRQNGLPIVMTFTDHTGLPAIPYAFTWRGNDGCNWTSGVVSADASSGRITTSGISTTDKACIGFVPTSPNEVDVTLAAKEVRIVNGDLQLFNEHRQIIGIFSRVGSDTSPPSRSIPLPGTVPTAADLVSGSWRGPIGRAAAFLGHQTKVTAVTFEYSDLIVNGARGDSLTWRGYDGCNWAFGDARLSHDGQLSTSHVGTTLVGCIGPNGEQIHPVSSVDVLQAASQVRLVEGRLNFYNDAGQLLGILEPFTP